MTREAWIEKNKIAYVLRAADGSIAAQFDISATLRDAMQFADQSRASGERIQWLERMLKVGKRLADDCIGTSDAHEGFMEGLADEPQAPAHPDTPQGSGLREAFARVREWEFDGRTTFDSGEVWPVIEAFERAFKNRTPPVMHNAPPQGRVSDGD